MAPKIRAAIEFANIGSTKAIIKTLNSMGLAMQGNKSQNEKNDLK